MRTRFEVETKPEEDGPDALRPYMQGPAATSVLFDLDQWLRAKVKYAPDDQPEAATDAYQKTRDQLREFLQEEGVVIDG